MSQRKMVPGLRHERMGLKDAEFFAHIDANGGWPLGYRYVGFVHSDEREAGFCNSPNNDGWWTVIASADDYYLWKLSPEALQRIVDATVSAIRLPRVDAQKLSIKNWRGWSAALAVAVPATADAMKQADALRTATLQAVFLDLLGQVDKFIAEQGEADFYTGPARAMQAILNGKPPADYLREGLQRLMAEHGITGVSASDSETLSQHPPASPVQEPVARVKRNALNGIDWIDLDVADSLPEGTLLYATPPAASPEDQKEQGREKPE